MNPYRALDKFVGRLLWKFVIKMEAKAYLNAGIVNEPRVLTKAVWDRKSKDFKGYGVKYDDVYKVVEKVCEVKPLKGLKLKLALRKARATIAKAVKEKRVVFLSENKASYTDRGFSNYKLNFYELADMFIDKTKQGFNREQVVKIIQEEYKRSRK